MRFLLFIFTLIFIFSIISFKESNAQQTLYNFDFSSPRVNIGGQPHFKVDYYPGTTNTNYKGDFYPDVESNTNVKKYSFTVNTTLTAATNYKNIGLTPTYVSNGPATIIADINVVLIVPFGITVTIITPTPIPAILVRGRLVLSPTVSSLFQCQKVIVFPGGVFESIPSTNSNHSIVLNSFDPTDYPTWDPLHTSSFISLGGKVTLRGFDTSSIWTGVNNSFSSYGGTFLKSFPYPTSYQPVYKLTSALLDTLVNNNVNYTLNNYYTKLSQSSGVFHSIDSQFGGAGYILMRPITKNLFVRGVFSSSMVFTFGSLVDIQNAVFTDLGHTTSSPLDDYTLDATYSITHVGTNPPDRYPITLLHNNVSVNIQNNMFAPLNDYTFQQSSTPRAYIGAKRSFGIISGNAFALNYGISGISLLYGTEQFNVSFNSFISVYTDKTVPSSRSYPDIDYKNGGIITTSPYSTYEGNAFEGSFKGGAFQVIPLQSRTSLAGLAEDILLGSFNNLKQNNTKDYLLNSLWNSVVFKNHFLAGEAEFRVNYISQPPIKINLFGGWFVGQRASTTLGSTGNNANIEFVYDSPYIANSLSVNDRQYIFESNTHTGTYNAITIKNALSISTYKFFAETFKCKYISIVDSKFSHFSNTSNFMKKYTNQLYLSNVNGTKTNLDNSISYFFPLYNFSSVALSPNQLNFSYIPNYDYIESEGQSVSYIVNDVYQSTVPNLFKASLINNATSNVVNLPFANGEYVIMVSAKSYSPIPSPTYSEAGSFYASSFVVDSNSNSFYLGIDLTPDVEATRRALSIFGNSWTKCGWINPSNCITTGIFSKVPTALSSVTNGSNTVTAVDSVSMLTTYLINDVINNIPSSVNISLPGNQQYKIFLYTYNPSFEGNTIFSSLPLYTIKIDGNYQEPFTRTTPQYQYYQKLGPFFWNNPLSTQKVLNIQWAADNTMYGIPICGVEIYSSLSTPYPIPISS
ncbi:hypothetical protein RB653_004415 [Dictyostelium firmibasis]|uniref:Uncharacterized protein n=1 Tax=Dictyostelium firmibasis TaxID=79012 RepID=A0AAN7U0Y5_9MYCE